MNRRGLYGLLFIAIIVLSGFVFMYLWNAIVPQLVHLPVINYWQTLALLLLAKILFGRFNPGLMPPYYREADKHLLKDKLDGMSDDEKAAFKEEWRKRCEKR